MVSVLAIAASNATKLSTFVFLSSLPIDHDPNETQKGNVDTARRHFMTPQIAFGCYQSKDAYASVTSAIKAGYRIIDTARVYKNEDAVGRAVNEAMYALRNERSIHSRCLW